MVPDMSEYPVLPTLAGQKFFTNSLKEAKKKEQPRAQTKLVMRNPFKKNGEFSSEEDDFGEKVADLPPMLETLDVQPIVAHHHQTAEAFFPSKQQSTMEGFKPVGAMNKTNMKQSNPIDGKSDSS